MRQLLVVSRPNANFCLTRRYHHSSHFHYKIAWTKRFLFNHFVMQKHFGEAKLVRLHYSAGPCRCYIAWVTNDYETEAITSAIAALIAGGLVILSQLCPHNMAVAEHLG